jgi:histidinol dehydrogenase
MELLKNPERNSWGKIIQRPMQDNTGLEQAVAQILAQVESGGDQALKALTTKYDGVENAQLCMEIGSEEPELTDQLKQAIKAAYRNIHNFHLSQKTAPNPVETAPGVKCWRRSTPIEKVGLYVPGGTAPLFSTLLMLGVPAQIAGCGEIVVCTPLQPDGTVHPAIIYTAQLLNIKKLYPIGGAQAIGAMAYGTETVPKVYKILGPGNQYVTMAKQIVSQQVPIDFPAGPSEVAVLADSNANPNFIAADLLSQAEHGADSQVVLVTDSLSIIDSVQQSLSQQLESLPRKNIAQQALRQSKLVFFDQLETAMEFINAYAPEHLILNADQADHWAAKVTNAGSVFLGAYTPESAGDYASGTNHTLPTNGNARMYAGVSLDTYVKKITFQEITPEGLEAIGDTIETMASAEGLDAHKRSVSIRRLNRPSS